ncbi:hypothetical protein T10_4633 [Trichinella papuae]|uniref:Uncharacterized protein n=1 Tax=Trichinella papuae TaxID=268474 RepID=A0A0V1M7K1_9BILA|nr:hypothetical protein T10_4633 [Trichinella papuae]
MVPNYIIYLGLDFCVVGGGAVYSLRVVTSYSINRYGAWWGLCCKCRCALTGDTRAAILSSCPGGFSELASVTLHHVYGEDALEPIDSSPFCLRASSSSLRVLDSKALQRGAFTGGWRELKKLGRARFIWSLIPAKVLKTLSHSPQGNMSEQVVIDVGCAGGAAVASFIVARLSLGLMVTIVGTSECCCVAWGRLCVCTDLTCLLMALVGDSCSFAFPGWLMTERAVLPLSISLLTSFCARCALLRVAVIDGASVVVDVSRGLLLAVAFSKALLTSFLRGTPSECDFVVILLSTRVSRLISFSCKMRSDMQLSI